LLFIQHCAQEQRPPNNSSKVRFFLGRSKQYSLRNMSASETNLVNEARGGNEKAFTTLYKRYAAGLFRYAWRMTGSRAAAEDVIQECFLALTRGSTFDSSRGSLQTYLFGMARHLVLRHLRISGREAEELAEAAAPLDLLDGLLIAERSDLVRQAVASLSALQREAIILFEYEELSLENVATITGTNVGTIKARLCRARESLRRRLGPLLSHNMEKGAVHD
jgi:RNA polymerase sigma-70 factor (ECF subfamily)